MNELCSLGNNVSVISPKWELAPSLGEERLKELTAPPSFETIVEKIKREMEVLCCHSDPCCDIAGFKRVIYCIKVCPTLFDLFFNSRNGYRASYYRSPYDGLRANHQFIHSLSSALLESDKTISAARESQFAVESLMSPSAKAWLVEPQRGLCEGCAGEWNMSQDDTAEIRNDRWECGGNTNARWGRKAPYLTKIRIFGAFVNERHDEFVPGRKRHRAKDIHEHGWS